MVAALALTLLVSTSSASGYSSFIKDGQVHIDFYDLTQIRGPFKFYVSANGTPAAGCSTCPDGVVADYVVSPASVYQTWPQGGHYAEASFPLDAVGGMQFFYFTAVTCVPGETVFLGTGTVPTVQPQGRRAK